MGRVGQKNQSPAGAPPSTPPLKHFTHAHELHPLSLYNSQTLCSGCKLQSSGTMYTCTPCNFTLHQSCAKLPQRITHPGHGGCKLTLLTTTTYPGGAFNCDACSRGGDGWSYHCNRCEYDLHVTCAAKPLKIRHGAHSSCDLELTFKNPYVNADGFWCDICRKMGSKQWLYRCSSCEFDIHLDCTSAAPPPVPPLQHHHSFPVGPGSGHHDQMLTHSASTGHALNVHSYFQNPPPPPAVNAPQVNAVVGNPYYGANQFQGPANAAPQLIHGSGPGVGHNMMMAAMQGFVEGAFQGVGQAVVQDFASGGGDGGGGGGGGDGGGGGEF